MQVISGTTYPVKEALKALGGRWDAQAKAWEVPDDKAAEAQALVDQAIYGRGGVWSSRWPRQTARTTESDNGTT